MARNILVFQEEKNLNWTFIIALALQILSSFGCLIYLLARVKLNGYIKAILVIMISFNLICSSASFLVQLILEDVLQCQITSFFWSMMTATCPMTGMISISRFYMAKLASKAKLARRRFMIPFIVFGTTVLYGYVAAMPLLNLKLGYITIFERCQKYPEKKDRNEISVLVAVAMYFGVCFAGLVCDILMYRFVKGNRGKDQNVTSLVPWKSTTGNEEEDVQVPIRATIISTTTIIMVLSGFMSFYASNMISNNPETSSYQYAVLTYSLLTILPIFLLVFTVKQQVKVISAQPPQGLQFHEESPKGLEDIEMQNVE